jgi:hypothetical protein
MRNSDMFSPMLLQRTLGSVGSMCVPVKSLSVSSWLRGVSILVYRTPARECRWHSA